MGPPFSHTMAYAKDFLARLGKTCVREMGPVMDDVLVRRDMELREHVVLCGDACFSDESVGRLVSEEPDSYRTCFQRDRDRILHSKSFRRLAHKTQVFLAPEGDHYRTRLTHSLEVTQIARDISRSLCLNEDLTEAIGLGHDLGHTPFGHTGEDALSRAIAQYRGVTEQASAGLFRHNCQSVRIVDLLEKGGRGLNLTREVVDGIECHTGDRKAMTLEGRVVAISDRIAYVTHDVDDAERAGLLREEDLPVQVRETLGSNASERISTMVRDVVEASARSGDICMSNPVWNAMMGLRAFLGRHIYTKSDAKVEEPKANRLIYELFWYFVEHIDEVPSEYRVHAGNQPEIQVADFVSGMTDRYAIRTYQDVKVPRAWRMGGQL